MMGLLDSMDDPRTMGLLSLGMGMLNSRGNFGQALGQAGPQALEAVRQVQMDKQRRAQQEQMQKMQALQMQQAQMQIAEQQRAGAEAEAQRGRDEQFRSAIPAPVGAPMAQGATPFGGFNIPGAVDPTQQLLYQALLQRQIKPMDYLTATQKDKTPIKLGKDDRLLDPITRQELVGAAPDKPDLNSLIVMGPDGKPMLNQLAFDAKQLLARAGATKVQVSADQRFENEYSKDQGKQFSDTMAGINKTAFMAPAQIRKLERMEQLLDGVDGGKLAPTGLDIASAANSIGIKLDPKLGNKEAAQALAREIAGGFRQPGSGPMTDKDFENFLLQVPDLSKTAEGRKQITSTMKAAAARDIAIAKLARDYEKKNGKLDNGFLDEAAQYIAENPVIGMPSGWKVR
jgi:hypothetical protein